MSELCDVCIYSPTCDAITQIHATTQIYTLRTPTWPRCDVCIYSPTCTLHLAPLSVDYFGGAGPTGAPYPPQDPGAVVPGPDGRLFFARTNSTPCVIHLNGACKRCLLAKVIAAGSLLDCCLIAA